MAPNWAVPGLFNIEKTFQKFVQLASGFVLIRKKAKYNPLC